MVSARSFRESLNEDRQLISSKQVLSDCDFPNEIYLFKSILPDFLTKPLIQWHLNLKSTDEKLSMLIFFMG